MWIAVLLPSLFSSQGQVSLDARVLFTSIPTEEVEVIRQRQTQDHNWQARTNMHLEYIIQLLEMCLKTTYFVYKGNILKQTKCYPSCPL